MEKDKKVSSFTYDLLERESQTEEQKERREQSGAPDLNALSERLRDKGKGYHS